MKIQTNTAANSALGYMKVNNMATERSIQKLSSGFRINRAGDDAAGLALANKLRADSKGLGQAQRNASQGTAMLQIMDGATQTVSTILDRMKELATQANSANVGDQAGKLQNEFTQLTNEIDRIVGTTKYQGTTLLNGGFGAQLNDTASSAVYKSTAFSPTAAVQGVALTGANSNVTLTATGTNLTASIVSGGATHTQTIDISTLSNGVAGQQINFDKIGVNIQTGSAFANTAAGATALAGTIGVSAGAGAFQVSSSGNYSGQDQISINSVNLQSTALKIDGASVSILTQSGAAAALTALDNAASTVNNALGSIGSAQSRFDFASSNVATMLQNTQAAESTIRDADMAQEMTNFTKNNILQQAAQAMLSQANQGTQGILQLLRG